MAKALVALVVQRVWLLFVAIAATYFVSKSVPGAGLWKAIVDRIAVIPESASVGLVAGASFSGALHLSQSPFLLAAGWLVKLTALTPPVALLILSNVFLILFLIELSGLLNRFVMPDVADQALVLAVLWPTGYELSLGSSFVVVCWLATVAVRHALDNQWLFSGLALGFCALEDLSPFGLIPGLACAFWFFQRHFEKTEVGKRLLFFLVPIGLVAYLKYSGTAPIRAAWAGSAFSELMRSGSLGSWKWTFSHSFVGQTVAALAMGTGAVALGIGSPSWMHRALVASVVVAWIGFSPYTALASRALFAGVALGGIALRWPWMGVRLMKTVSVGISTYEVLLLFS